MEIEFNAEIRKDIGKNLKALREKGLIPAIVYGQGQDNIAIQLDYQKFKKVFEQAGESTILKLKIQMPNAKEEIKNVLIHDIAKDPVSDEFIHVDFYQVRMDKVITTEVPLVFDGEAPAVKNLEGVLIKNIIEVEVEALPKDLPHEIKVDISVLETFDDHIKINDLKLPQGVKVKIDSEEVIASVKPPRTEEELAELEEKPEEKEVVEEEEKEGEESAESPEDIKASEPASTQRGKSQSEGLGGEK